jgi:hypothetical protein
LYLLGTHFIGDGCWDLKTFLHSTEHVFFSQ